MWRIVDTRNLTRLLDRDMQFLAATSSDATTLLLWCGGTMVLLFAVGGGFVAGIVCAPWLQEWAVRRASSQIHKMYALVVEELERAHRLLAELAATTRCSLSLQECQHLEQLRDNFRETFDRVAKASGYEGKPTPAESPETRPTTFTVDWNKSPSDGTSGLPSHLAFEQNLKQMLSQGKEFQLESGLLLIRMDKAESLRKRLGASAVESLFNRLISIVVRSARDQDLLCRLSPDTLGLLCPALPPLTGTKVAEKIREMVRNGHFRVEESGPEILVTASFGYANCGPSETPQAVRERANDGLIRSQSLGRNQLHVHDGQVRALCRA